MGLPLITLEIFLGFGVPLAWGIWELVSLRRAQRRDAEKEAQRSQQQAAMTEPSPGDDAETATRDPPRA